MLYWTSNPRRIFPYFATCFSLFIKQGARLSPIVFSLAASVYTAFILSISPLSSSSSLYQACSIQLSSNLKSCHRERLPLIARPLGFMSVTAMVLINHEILRFLSSLSFHILTLSKAYISISLSAVPNLN